MADFIRFELDDSALVRALQQLGPAVERHTLPACKVTADNVAREARQRLQRQLGPEATGKTVAGILVELAESGDGYVVIAERNPFPDLPGWLEHGTRHMDARPFFDVSARLEEAAHRRRLEDAVQAAIDEVGLGV